MSAVRQFPSAIKKPASVLVCGAVAYDVIHLENGESMKDIYGGCSGNIASGLAALGEDPVLVSMVGHDFVSYRNWLESRGVDCGSCMLLPDRSTARVSLTNLPTGEQGTRFEAGVSEGPEVPVLPCEEVDLAVLTSDQVPRTLAHAGVLSSAEIPYVFDPGPAIYGFSKSELCYLVSGAALTIVNQKESEALAQCSGQSHASLAETTGMLVITYGKLGSQLIFPEGNRQCIRANLVEIALDPTGCGDAYRAALISARLHGATWEEAANQGSAMAAVCLAYRGGQGYLVKEILRLHDA